MEDMDVLEKSANDENLIKQVTFLTFSRFPEGDAGAIRYLNLAESFGKLGYDSVLLGRGFSKYQSPIPFRNGIFVSLRPFASSSLPCKILNKIAAQSRIIKYAEKNCKTSKIFVVSQYFSASNRKKINRFCKKNNIKLIYSVMEAYSPSEFKNRGRFSCAYHQNRVFLSRFKSSDGSVMAISNYIKNYFIQKDVNSEKIPFLLFPGNIPEIKHTDSEKTRFIYCGNPAGKDNLVKMILAFKDINPERYDLDIYGIDDSFVKKQHLSKNEKAFILERAHFHGSVKHCKIPEIYSNFDFSILLRPQNEQYSKAGFPTKVVESLFLSTPVLTNYTSDLADYLIDGINSIKVDGDSIEAFSKAIKRSIGLSKTEIDKMKTESRKSAEEKLSTDCYLSEISKLIGK
jgi:glycosyltransferase involved in cell wall biosynthesis